MSKISVTTIAGLTSGGDANKVIIESGDTLQVDSNATVGGTLGVTGATTTAGITSSAAHTVTTSTHANASVFKSTGNTQIMLQDTDASANDQFWGLQNSGGSFNILTCNDDRASGFVTPMEITQAGQVKKPLQPSFQAKSNIANQTLSNFAGTTAALTSYFNNEFFDIGGHYNTTNSTFTAPVAGRYYFFTQLQLNANPSTSDHSWGINLHFQVNGAGNHANGYESLSTSATSLLGSYGLVIKENILNLAANDTVRVALSGNGNINAGTIETSTNDGRCRFGGHFLG